MQGKNKQMPFNSVKYIFKQFRFAEKLGAKSDLPRIFVHCYLTVDNTANKADAMALLQRTRFFRNGTTGSLSNTLKSSDIANNSETTTGCTIV